jgi:hypothetical protein
MVKPLAFQPVWLTRLFQVVTVALMLPSYVLVIVAIKTAPNYDPVTDTVSAAPTHDTAWNAYWWLQLPLLVMAIVCLARRQEPLGVAAFLVFLLGGVFIIGWALPYPTR